MPDLRAMFAQIDTMEDEIIALHRDLVQIPSVNTGFMPTGDETPVCEYIRDFLAEDGVESEILGRTPERGNIISRIEGRNSDARLMFMSHTDVVPVEEEEKWKFLRSARRYTTVGYMAVALPTARGCWPPRSWPCG